MAKTVRPARPNHVCDRTVHAVREHSKRARTPLAAFSNCPIIPGVFNKQVVPAVAEAMAQAAQHTGVTRKTSPHQVGME